jgi:peptidoglycan/LPS O-acetylase OafA/YrhL
MKEQLQKIDVLRGIAILLVFGHHALLVIFGEYRLSKYDGLWFDRSATTTKQLLLNLNPIGQGGVGVQIFLVISGFLIHLGYLKSGSIFQPLKFFNKRFWRIYPPYLIALVLFSILFGTSGAFSFFTHFTLTHNLFTSSFASINPSFWSLAAEMQLYIIYPVYLLLRKYFGLNGSVLIVAAISVLSTVLSTFFDISLGAYKAPSVPDLWIIWVLGAYLGERYYADKRVYTGSGIYLLVAYIAFLFLKLVQPFEYIANIYFATLCICAIDWYLNSAPILLFSSQRLTNLLALVGLYSYSIYLFHQPFLPPGLSFFSLHFANTPLCVLAIGVVFVLVFFFAKYSYKYLEMPSVTLGNKVFSKAFASRK